MAHSPKPPPVPPEKDRISAANSGSGMPEPDSDRSGEAERTEESRKDQVHHAEFRCDNCSAPMKWDPQTDSLHCQYCGNHVEVAHEEGDEIAEYSLDQAGSAATGLGREMRASRCGNCGATVAFDGHTTAKNCLFCGSANVLDQAANRNSIRPESLIPLDVAQEEIEQHFREWQRKKWFRPNAFKKLKKFGARGVYLPFWTFDCNVHSAWTAQSGTYYYVNVPHWTTVNGKRQMTMRRERRVRWRPAWGNRADHYDDVLVHASRGVSEKLCKQLGGFNLQKLVPYRPEYLAGWQAEEYQVDLDRGWKDAQNSVVERQRSRCANDVPGDTHRFLKVKNEFSETQWKHVLLPMWTLNYQFKSKNYAVLIHGQSGRVAGEAPLSFWKIFGMVLLVGVTLLVGFFVATGSMFAF